MEYEMGLQEKYFQLMKNGTKKIETRLNDEKRKKLKIGDTIYFLKEPDRKERIITKIIGLTVYHNFEDLLNNVSIEYLASIDMSKEKYLNDLEKYYSKDEQQQYGVLAIEIEKYEKSCGMIVIKNNSVLLVKHLAGHWGLPKGHVEENETEIETALRETYEETGIIAKKKTDFRKVITYSPKINTIKDVVFFIGTPENDQIIPQLSEIGESRYVDFDDVQKFVSHLEVNNLLLEAIEYWKNYIDKNS